MKEENRRNQIKLDGKNKRQIGKNNRKLTKKRERKPRKNSRNEIKKKEKKKKLNMKPCKKLSTSPHNHMSKFKIKQGEKTSLKKCLLP